MSALQTKKNPFRCISFTHLKLQEKNSLHNFNLNIHKISDGWIWHKRCIYPVHNRLYAEICISSSPHSRPATYAHDTKNCNGYLPNRAVSYGSSESIFRSWLQPDQWLICSLPAETSGHDKHYPCHAADGRAGGNPSNRKAKTQGASFPLGKWDELRPYWKEAGGS